MWQGGTGSLPEVKWCRDWKSELVRLAKTYFDIFRKLRAAVHIFNCHANALQYVIIFFVVDRRITVPRWALIRLEPISSYEVTYLLARYTPITNQFQPSKSR
jgi:hypothetical protein